MKTPKKKSNDDDKSEEIYEKDNSQTEAEMFKEIKDPE